MNEADDVGLLDIERDVFAGVGFERLRRSIGLLGPIITRLPYSAPLRCGLETAALTLWSRASASSISAEVVTRHLSGTSRARHVRAWARLWRAADANRQVA